VRRFAEAPLDTMLKLGGSLGLLGLAAKGRKLEVESKNFADWSTDLLPDDL